MEMIVTSLSVVTDATATEIAMVAGTATETGSAGIVAETAFGMIEMPMERKK
jgi:hypothetical protein